MIIYENNNYYVETGDSLVTEGATVYLCKNKITNIIEVEDQMLPRIIDYAKQLDEEAEKLMATGELYQSKARGH